MYCPVCGTRNLDDARFCVCCGAQMPIVNDADGYVAPASVPAVSPNAQDASMFALNAAPVPGSSGGVAQGAAQGAPTGFIPGTGQSATPGMQGTSSAAALSPEYLAVLQAGAPAQSQAAPTSIGDTIKRAEQASAAYKKLVDQLYELIQQNRNGAISAEVHANAWRQLVSSHPDGEKAGKEALTNLASQLLSLMRNGAIAPSVYDSECRWIMEHYPDGKLAICEAEMQELQQRKNNGQISDEVFHIRMTELKKKRNEVVNPGPPPNPNDTGSFGFAVLGFFVPLVGLILYLVWKQERPRDAHQAGVGALTGVVTGVVFWLLYFIVIAAWTSSIVSSVPRYR